MHRIKYTLILKESVAVVLFSPGLEQLRDLILSNYASQRWSMHKNNLYRAICVEQAQYKTDRNLLPSNILVSFRAVLVATGLEVIKDCRPTVIEREYRRQVRIDHPLVTHRLGSINNMSQESKFVSRVIEYRRDNYRLIIDPKSMSFSIQYKKPLSRDVTFCQETLTLETLYISEEGPVIPNPLYVRDVDDEKRLIGVASFLDGLDQHSVKTIYLEDVKQRTVLYYRYEPDNHTTPFHYLFLEKELGNGNPDDDMSIYGQTAARLEAQLPRLTRKEMGSSNRLDGIPKHVAKTISPDTVAYRLPKLDGKCAALRFSERHFIISVNNVASSSHAHLIPYSVVHILRDYIFLVETDLYTINTQYRPSAIIDIKTSVFNAEQRMDIIQHLRVNLWHHLAPYHIFFQGEDVMQNDNNSEQVVGSHELQDGDIYEVLLDVDDPTYVRKVCKHRPDKQFPNPRKVIQEIIREVIIGVSAAGGE